MAFVSCDNHGSAAVATATAALLPSAGGATAATRAEYSQSPHHALARLAAPSADSFAVDAASQLGEPMSDGTGSLDLSFDQTSPELAPPRRSSSSLKRDIKSKLMPSKRLAVSVTHIGTAPPSRIGASLLRTSRRAAKPRARAADARFNSGWAATSLRHGAPTWHGGRPPSRSGNPTRTR